MGISVAMSKEACGALNSESVDSDALRREVHHSVKTIPEALEAAMKYLLELDGFKVERQVFLPIDP